MATVGRDAGLNSRHGQRSRRSLPYARPLETKPAQSTSSFASIFRFLTAPFRRAPVIAEESISDTTGESTEDERGVERVLPEPHTNQESYEPPRAALALAERGREMQKQPVHPIFHSPPGKMPKTPHKPVPVARPGRHELPSQQGTPSPIRTKRAPLQSIPNSPSFILPSQQRAGDYIFSQSEQNQRSHASSGNQEPKWTQPILDLLHAKGTSRLTGAELRDVAQLLLQNAEPNLDVPSAALLQNTSVLPSPSKSFLSPSSKLFEIGRSSTPLAAPTSSTPRKRPTYTGPGSGSNVRSSVRRSTLATPRLRSSVTADSRLSLSSVSRPQSSKEAQDTSLSDGKRRKTDTDLKASLTATRSSPSLSSPVKTGSSSSIAQSSTSQSRQIFTISTSHLSQAPAIPSPLRQMSLPYESPPSSTESSPMKGVMALREERSAPRRSNVSETILDIIKGVPTPPEPAVMQAITNPFEASSPAKLTTARSQPVQPSNKKPASASLTTKRVATSESTLDAIDASAISPPKKARVEKGGRTSPSKAKPNTLTDTTPPKAAPIPATKLSANGPSLGFQGASFSRTSTQANTSSAPSAPPFKPSSYVSKPAKAAAPPMVIDDDDEIEIIEPAPTSKPAFLKVAPNATKGFTPAVPPPVIVEETNDAPSTSTQSVLKPSSVIEPGDAKMANSFTSVAPPPTPPSQAASKPKPVVQTPAFGKDTLRVPFSTSSPARPSPLREVSNAVSDDEPTPSPKTHARNLPTGQLPKYDFAIIVNPSNEDANVKEKARLVTVANLPSYNLSVFVASSAPSTSKSFDWSAAGIKKPSVASGSWSCSVCMINNAALDTKCAACESPKPGVGSASSSTLPSFGSNATPTAVNGTKPIVSQGFDWTAAGMKQPQKTAGTWTCSLCMINNTSTAVKCASCETPKPTTVNGASSVSSTSSTPAPPPVTGFNWAAAGMAAPKVEAGSWTCSVCMINNKGGTTKCISCESPR